VLILTEAAERADEIDLTAAKAAVEEETKRPRRLRRRVRSVRAAARKGRARGRRVLVASKQKT